MKKIYTCLFVFFILVIVVLIILKDFSALKDVFTTFLGCFIGYISGIVFRQNGDKKQFIMTELNNLLSLLENDVFNNVAIAGDKVCDAEKLYKDVLVYQRKINNQRDFICQCLAEMHIDSNEIKTKIDNIVDKLTGYDEFGPNYLAINHDAIRQNVTKERTNTIAAINVARVEILKKYL